MELDHHHTGHAPLTPARRIRMDPRRVRSVARQWAGQQEELAAAASALARADTSGFSERVAPAARSFVEAWQHQVTGLAAVAGHEDAALRATADDWVRTDEAVSTALAALASYDGGQP
jgi:hypothetical protein